MEMKERAHLAAKRYLELSDHRVIYSDFLDRFIVIEDDEGIALVDVFVSSDNMSHDLPTLNRDVFEDAINKFFLQEHDLIDVSVRYDTIELFVLGKDRALIRHHVNAVLEG